MTAHRIRLPLLIAVSASLAGIFGCPDLQPANGVMHGTWLLTPSQNANPPVTNILLTFDPTGQLTTMSYTVNGTTLTWNDPPPFVAVDGTSVRITATQSGNGLMFDGTLNSATAPTSATGTLSANLVVGNLTVSVPQGTATLTKQ